MKAHHYILLAGLFLAVGCGNLSGPADNSASAGASGGTTTVGGVPVPPGANTVVVLNVPSAPAALTAQTASGATVTIAEAHVGIRKIDVVPSTSTADPTATEITGPFDVNLAGQSVSDLGASHLDPQSAASGSPVFDAVKLPGGSYSKVSVQLSSITESEGLSSTSPLSGGHTMEVKGTMNGQSFEVQMDDDEDDDMDCGDSSGGGMTVSDGSVTTMKITMHPESWMNGVDLSTATTDSNGVAVLSKTSNPTLMKQVKSNFESSCETEHETESESEHGAETQPS